MIKKFRLFSIALILIGLTACASVPESYSLHGEPVAVVSPLKLGCNTPFILTQHCNGFSGATLKIEINGIAGRIAASDDGKTILVMAKSTFTFSTSELTVLSSSIRALAEKQGIQTLETIASVGSQELAGVVYRFDGDVLSKLSQFAI